MQLFIIHAIRSCSCLSTLDPQPTPRQLSIFRFAPYEYQHPNERSLHFRFAFAFYRADDDSSVSFASEAPTSPNHCTPSKMGQENVATCSLASRSSVWIRSGDGNSHQNSTYLDNSITGGNGAADITARIYSSSTSSAESSAGEMEELGQGYGNRTRRHGYSRLVARKASTDRCQRQRAERDELVASLRSQLSVDRSQLEQKTVVARSLQRQLDQVCFCYCSYSG